MSYDLIINNVTTFDIYEVVLKLKGQNQMLSFQRCNGPTNRIIKKILTVDLNRGVHQTI